MKYKINRSILSQASNSLSKRHKLYWVVGGAGSGKTTICQILSNRFGIPVYDMDSHIYGTYHARFTKERHPTNFAWKNAQNGLEWLLSMSWDEFDSFNQSALAEYLDLFAEDVQSTALQTPLLIDGGICNPGLLVQALPANQIVCLSRLHHSSKEIWEETKERRGMKKLIDKLEKPEKAWRAFLEFDTKITQTMKRECRESKIVICTRIEDESPTAFSNKVSEVLALKNHHA